MIRSVHDKRTAALFEGFSVRNVAPDVVKRARMKLALLDAAAAPAAPVTPGDLLREEWLEPLGLTAYRLAKEIGVPTNRVSAFLAGQRAITAGTAFRLARYFGADAESWSHLQMQYDLAVERRAHGEEIARAVRPRVAA